MQLLARSRRQEHRKKLVTQLEQSKRAASKLEHSQLEHYRLEHSQLEEHYKLEHSQLERCKQAVRRLETAGKTGTAPWPPLIQRQRLQQLRKLLTFS